MEKLALVYVRDPMCSWCFGFTRKYRVIVKKLDKST